MMEAIKSRSEAPVMWHTCGSVYDVLEDLIDIGVDSLNPVQTSAARMDPVQLKQNFGDRLSFWGGIDTMRVLNQGTREEVRQEFIINPIHNVQPDVPVSNLLEMIDAALEFGWYPIE
jgi:uroporphyrinogen decarboxylase